MKTLFKQASQIKVGVIGYGGAYNMGKSHLHQMKEAGMTPTAVTELDPARLDVARADYPGIGTYSSVEEMLKKSDVNLVTIITPHNTHAPLALQCLKAGRHVVCEKPFAITTAECDAMIAAAKKSGVMLSTYHNRHWDGCAMRAVKTIRSGAIGEIVRVEAHMANYQAANSAWRCSKKISGGVLYDWGVHLLEYALQLIDSDLVEVNGFAKSGYWAKTSPWKNDTVEDEGFVTARFSDGKWLTLCISRIDSNPKPSWLEFTGTKGSYVFDGGRWELTTCGEHTTVVKGSNPPGEGWRFYKNVANHLVKGEKLVITPEWARRPIQILDLANQSAKKGCAIKVARGGKR